MATDHSLTVGELRSWAEWSHRGNAPVELAVLLDEAAAALAAPPVEQQAAEPALQRACDLLSMTIGTLMGHRVKIGYTDNSPIAALVREAVEFLRPWPEKMPTTQPAPQAGVAAFDYAAVEEHRQRMRKQVREDAGHPTEQPAEHLFSRFASGLRCTFCAELESDVAGKPCARVLAHQAAHPTEQPSQDAALVAMAEAWELCAADLQEYEEDAAADAWRKAARDLRQHAARAAQAQAQEGHHG